MFRSGSVHEPGHSHIRRKMVRRSQSARWIDSAFREKTSGRHFLSQRSLRGFISTTALGDLGHRQSSVSWACLLRSRQRLMCNCSSNAWSPGRRSACTVVPVDWASWIRPFRNYN